jgi:hypothetical protein
LGLSVSARIALLAGVFLLAYCLLYIVGRPVLADPDAGWHMMAGRWILAHGTVPHYDPFSFTAGKAQPWYNLAWLWDIGLAWLGKRYGDSSLYIVQTSLIAGMLTLLAYTCLARARTAALPVAESAVLVYLALACAILQEYASIRPHFFTFACVVLWHHMLHQSRAQHAHMRAILYGLLPAIAVVWANIHGGILVLGTLYGAYAYEAWYTRQWRWLRVLVCSGVLTAVASLITPLGWEIGIGTWRTLHSSITPRISEWQPPSLGNWGFMLAVLLLLCCNWGRPRTNPPLADMVLAIVWTAACLHVSRYVPIWIVVIGPLAITRLQAMMEALAIHQRRKPERGLFHDCSIRRSLALLYLAILLPVLLGLHPVRHALKGSDLLVTDRQRNAMLAYHAVLHQAPSIRWLNEYGLGGLQLYITGGRIPVFMDGRAPTVYTEQVLQDHLRMVDGKRGWPSVLQGYNVEGVILLRTHPLCAKLATLPEAWTPLSLPAPPLPTAMQDEDDADEEGEFCAYVRHDIMAEGLKSYP